MQSFGLDTAHNCFAAHLLLCWQYVHCSKSAQKFAVQVCQVTIIVMETTQLVLSQLNNFLPFQLRIE